MQPMKHFLSFTRHPVSAVLARNIVSGSSSSRSKWRLSIPQLAAVTLAGGIGVACVNQMRRIQRQNNQTIPQMIDSFELSSPPPYFPPARSIRIAGDNTGLKVTLFQYQTCPFCCKARAFLDYFGINYDVVEVNSVTRTQMKWSKYRKVPTVIVSGGGCSSKTFQLNDSSVIISALWSFLHQVDRNLEDVLKGYPVLKSVAEDGNEKLEFLNKYFLMHHGKELDDEQIQELEKERMWRDWVDNTLVHTLSPNVYRTPSEALQAFSWFDEAGNWQQHFATWERYLIMYAGAPVMYVIGRRLKKRHGLKPDVRESLYDECRKWCEALKMQGTPFMGGQQPDLSDLAVYGVLSAIEGCQAFQDALQHSSIGPWYERVKHQCQIHAGGRRQAKGPE